MEFSHITGTRKTPEELFDEWILDKDDKELLQKYRQDIVDLIDGALNEKPDCDWPSCQDG